MSETIPKSPEAAKKVEPPFSGPMASAERWLHEMVYEKVPYKLPKSVQDILVQFGPWITLVIALLSLPAIFAIFGLNAVVSLYGAAVGVIPGPLYYIGIVILVIQVVMMFLAISPLLKRQRQGWLLVFYSTTISVVYSVVSSFSYGYFAFTGILWGLVAAAISYYVLFQIRSHYK
jgi:hypothetical protein